MKYEYGVEYETNGKKPDLPDDVSVVALSKLTGYRLPCFSVGIVNWRNTEKFKIVDERYKPKEKDMNDWYKKGELPPVGAVVEVKHKGCWQKTKIVGHDDEWAVYTCEGFDGECTYVAGYPKLFRPIRTEKDKLVDEIINVIRYSEDEPLSHKGMATALVEANWRQFKPMGEDDFVVECVSKFSLRKVSPDAQEACCELSRAIYQAGCRFLDKGK